MWALKTEPFWSQKSSSSPVQTGRGTTFALEYLKGRDETFLSADAIAQRLNPEQPAEARIQAGRLFIDRLEETIARRESFVVETTLAGRGFERVLDRLRAVGYRITIVFLFLDTPALCIQRVRERVRKGGHDVPEEAIVRRFYRSKKNFWRVYRHRADEWHLIYSAKENFQDVAVGEGRQHILSDQTLFDLFLDDVDT